MANIVQVIEDLAKGKGVFRGDPLFVMADGQVVDKDGREVVPANEIGAAAYTAFPGYTPNANPTATVRGGVLAAAKGAGDTVVCKVGTDGKLYVPAYPTDAQYDMTAFMVEVDEVAAALPYIYNDDDFWVDEGAAKIYVATNGAWVENTGVKVAEVAEISPVIYVVGDFWVKQNAGADELFVQTANAWVASAAPFSEAATAPGAPTAGDYYFNTADNKLYYCAVSTWAEVTTKQYVRAASAPVIYVEGDYCYNQGGGGELLSVQSGAWVSAETPCAYQASAPTLYPVGYLLADQDTKKIYEREATDWDAGTSLVAGKLYTDGTDIYVFGSGSLAKI